jgi:hypothetical protein
VPGPIPAYCCRAVADGYRSRCAPQATRRREAKTGPAPGRAWKSGQSGWLWARCALAVSQSVIACKVTRRWATRACTRRALGRDAPLIRGQGEGGSEGLETARDDLWRAPMMVPEKAFEGGATGELHRLQGWPATQDVAKDRGIFVRKPLQHVWARVLARPGQAMGHPDFVAHHAAAVCDALGERPHRGALRRAGVQLVAMGQQQCELECGIGGVVCGPAGGEGFARARQRQRSDGEEDEQVIRAQGGDQRPLVKFEADSDGLAVAPRAQRGAPRVNGLGRVLELQARTFGGASSWEAPIMLGIRPVDPKKSRKGVV